LSFALAHSIVDEIYPIGASNQTYNTFPSSSSIFTGIPQSRSLVTALGFNPLSNHDLTCPTTFVFHLSLFSTVIQFLINS